MPDERTPEAATPPAKIVVLSGLSEGRTFEFVGERAGIGRDDDNAVRFEDVSVSHHHSVIERVSTVFNLRDLASINGTFVNGRRISETVLRDGDLIRFGGVDARFEQPSSVGRAPGMATATTPAIEYKPAPGDFGAVTTYKIVGADGRVYGPVGATQVRNWIAQCWANAQTWVPSEKGRRWRRLAEFPEFADAFASQRSAGPVVGVPPDDALWSGTLKIGPSPESIEKLTTFQTDEAVAGEEPSVAGMVWPLVVILVAIGGWLVVAYQFIWWPFTPDAPLRRFARAVDERILLDPAFSAATAAEDAKDNSELLKQSGMLVDRYPSSAQAHYILGVAYSRVPDLTKATKEFQRAVELKDDYADAWNNLGWAQTQRGNLADAVAAFERTIKLTPDDAQAWSNLGRALAGMGRDNEAITAYRKAIDLDAGYAQAHYNLGTALAKQRNFREAIESLRQAIRLKPDFAEAWFNLGVVTQMQGLDDGALVFYQQAVKLRPGYADAWGGLVKAYIKLGQQDKASEAAAQIQKLDPAKAEALAEELRRIAPR